MSDQGKNATHRLGRITSKSVSWFNPGDEYSNTACLYCS